MAVSGTISTTVFNTRRVIDTAFRRCRLPAQAITPEMQDYAKDALYLFLSNLANGKAPSWCIDRLVLPFYENQPVITLPVGTVEVLNANYRVTQQLNTIPANITTSSTSYVVDMATDTSTAATVNTVGIKWTAAAVSLTFAVSDDALTWTTVGTQSTVAASGEWTWTDIDAAKAYRYFRITSVDPLSYSSVYLGTLPQEIPLGPINRDTYATQSNRVFPGRPNSFWYQRNRTNPVMNVWPAPFAAAENAQLIVWRHRHIMDVGTLQQEIEVPQHWMEALIANTAAMVAAETPTVDANLVPALEAKALAALQIARDGDNDGSSTYIQPAISAYTR